MDVLVGIGRLELAGTNGMIEIVERSEHRCQLVVGEQAGATQHSGVRFRRGEVVGRQSPIEMHRQGQLRQSVGRATRESPAPQPSRGLLAHIRHI